MIFRTLGKTGLKLSVISFGGSSLGGVFRNIDEGKAIETVFAALDAGINFLDISPYYGHYKAETVMGKALKQVNRERFILSTKVGRYGSNGTNVFDYSAKKVRDSVFESMERLNVGYIDLINVHDIEFSNIDQIINETLPALNELRSEGLAGHVGITGLPLENLRSVVEKAEPGTVDSILTFCHYTLQDQSLLNYMDAFLNRGIGIINASPLSMGLLSERGAPSWHPASERLKKHCRDAADYCKSKSCRIEQVAIAYCVNQPNLTTTIIGTADPENIRQNVKWALEPLEPEMVRGVQRILEPVMHETWLNS